MSELPAGAGGIALIGARGTGKTTVGRILAERLGCRFLDADRALEDQAGKSIARIFAEEGEPAFRDWEERVLARLTADRCGVLATGGGAVLSKANRARLREFGTVFWLSADAATLVERLEADAAGLSARPALTDLGTLGEIAAIIAARTEYYEQAADFIIDTRESTPSEVAETILALLASDAPASFDKLA